MRAESQQATSLEVVIVSYACKGQLRDCLASLCEHPPRGPMSIHVVDNASDDGTAEMVAREFPGVRLTVLGHNAGFSAANNVALRQLEAPYALILNPDTRVTEGALQEMIDLVEGNPRIGIAGPRLLREDGMLDHAAKRAFPTPASALGHFTGIGRRRSGGALAAYRAPAVDSGPVDAVNGAFMLIRREVLEQVGLFDEGYWMYMEDLDLCYRSVQAGWLTWYEPAATVIHIKAGTTGGERKLRLNYAFHYGMYRFFRTHYAKDRNFLLNGAVYCGIVLKLVVSVVRSVALRTVRRLRGGVGR